MALPDQLSALEPALFSDLPYEIRCLIWEATFEPRQISLTRETIKLTRTFKSLFKHITVVRTAPGNTNPNIPPAEYTSFLTCPKIDSPIALCVCHESREIGLSRYRPWKMFNSKLKYRNIMWYPQIDVVNLIKALDTPENLPIVQPLPLVQRQFQVEMTEVKNLVVPSTLWGQGQHKNIDVIWPLIDFVSLEDFVVVLDVPAEREFALKFDVGLSTVAQRNRDHSWTIPEEIEEHIEKMRNHYRKYGPEYMPLRKKPKVRIVRQESEILGDKDMHVIIRCKPCTFLESIPASASGEKIQAH